MKPPDLKKFRRLFFVYARVKCDLYRFFPVGVGTFPTELSGSSAMSFLRQGQVRKPSPGTYALE
ncbi:hypothetical protein DW047_04750 [Phocaeicola vulgatus]|nr:hypothetical protein DW047_04750 [Phocaeicola vulgatus]